MNPQSRASWGRRQERTEQELNKLCGDAFRALKIPKHWKFEEYDRCRLHADNTSEIQSIGAWFLDTRTKGIDTKRYRIWFHTYAERLGITEKIFTDFAKPKFNLITHNKTPEQINEIITENL